MSSLPVGFSLDGETVTIVPPRFFALIGRKGFDDLMTRRDGITNQNETRRIWRLLHRTDPPPPQVRLIVREADLELLFPPGTKPAGSWAAGLNIFWAIVTEH